MTEASEAAAREYFQGLYCEDRKKGLCAFGVLWIIVGAYYAIDVLWKTFGWLVSYTPSRGAPAPGAVARWALWYILVAAWFLCMGIGSIQARRWARALVLVSAWYWLIYGIESLAAFLLWGPDVYAQWAQDGWIPSQDAAVMKIGELGRRCICDVVVPYLAIRFYGNQNVKATCERRDKQVRWTDACPLPVLFIGFAFSVWGLSTLLAGLGRGWTITFLGTIVTGRAGAAVILVNAAVCAYVAWETYHLRMRAWFVAFLVETFWAVEALTLVWGAGHTERQIEMMGYRSVGHVVLLEGWRLAFLVYLLYARRFFMPAIPVPVAAEIVDANSSDVSKPLSL